MSFDFNVHEIFQTAILIEKNGAKFYRRMSESVSNESVRKMLLDLTSMEQAHEKTFSAMSADLSEEDTTTTVFDPEGETTSYLRALANLRVYTDTTDNEFLLPEDLSEQAKIRKIFRAAINLEWESIGFYLGMKELVPENLGKGKIDDIIKEEMKHVRLLSEHLISLDG